MKVKELVRLLKQFDENETVYMSSDGEGNRFMNVWTAEPIIEKIDIDAYPPTETDKGCLLFPMG